MNGRSSTCMASSQVSISFFEIGNGLGSDRILPKEDRHSDVSELVHLPSSRTSVNGISKNTVLNIVKRNRENSLTLRRSENAPTPEILQTPSCWSLQWEVSQPQE